MKANEIRIGNYIYDDESLVCIVNGFSPLDNSIRCNEKEGCNILVDYDDKKGYSVESIRCNPILLTENWLIKLGFSKKEYDTFGIKVKECNSEDFYKGWFMIFLNKSYGKIKSIEITIGDYRNDTFAEIKYVHELQNIYFLLTKGELTIKN